jgi:hypothetical protein
MQFYKAGPFAAAAEQHRVIFADNHAWGLDIHTSDKTWADFYAVDPTAGLNTTAQRANLLGGEACVWSVTFDSSVISATLWPRLLAVSERLWSPAAKTVNASAESTQVREPLAAPLFEQPCIVKTEATVFCSFRCPKSPPLFCSPCIGFLRI